MLILQVLTGHGGSVVHAGLLVSALPAGSGLGAVAGERILPGRWLSAAPPRWRSPPRIW